MIKGKTNRVQFRVASIADFLIMKSYALAKRDKPKDAYDICFCLDNYPGGLEKLAANWKKRAESKDIIKAIRILKEKFETVDSYGTGQVVEFYNSAHEEERQRQARRAYELMQEFLKQVS